MTIPPGYEDCVCNWCKQDCFNCDQPLTGPIQAILGVCYRKPCRLIYSKLHRRLKRYGSIEAFQECKLCGSDMNRRADSVGICHRNPDCRHEALRERRLRAKSLKQAIENVGLT